MRRLWRQLDSDGPFDLSGTPLLDRVACFGFVSESSTHHDRLETIRRAHRECNQIIDTHAADGLKVGLEHREEGVPLVCPETALLVKFTEKIR